MLNPFFKNVGPFDIKKLLANTEIENKENFQKDKIYNVSDLVAATNKDLTFFHSKNYSTLASKTKASYCVTLDNLSKFLPDTCKKIIVTQKVENGYVRPVAWRGSEMMAISAQHTKIHVAIATWEWGSYFDPKLKVEGIKLNISNWRRPAPDMIPWDTKASGLYMICTLSKHEAEKQGYTDSLMLDHEGNVAEATGANIFFKDKKGELHTPIPDSFLDGITRRTVIDIAKSKNIKVHERKINPKELPNFVGCFLTGTAAEVTPVSCISENQFKVCDMIIDLNESYQTLVKKKKAA